MATQVMRYNLSRDGNFDLDTGLQADASLEDFGEMRMAKNKEQENTYDLLDDLARRVQVDQALVNLQLVTIPGLGTLTTRLWKNVRLTNLRNL